MLLAQVADLRRGGLENPAVRRTLPSRGKLASAASHGPPEEVAVEAEDPASLIPRLCGSAPDQDLIPTHGGRPVARHCTRPPRRSAGPPYLISCLSRKTDLAGVKEERPQTEVRGRPAPTERGHTEGTKPPPAPSVDTVSVSVASCSTFSTWMRVASSVHNPTSRLYLWMLHRRSLIR
jgi:hypothetical protein